MHPLLTTLLGHALTLGDNTGKQPKNPTKTGTGADKAAGKGGGAADKADTATNTGSGGTGGSGDDGGLLGALGGLIWDHKWLIPVLFLAASIGINYLWKQYRTKQSMRGVAVRPLGPILSDIIKFARVEDKRPVHPKLPPKVTANRVYGALALLIVLSLLPVVPDFPLGPVLPGIPLLLMLGSRYSKVARARRSILNQMFAVANSECRYPRGSELAPWNYVQIAGWTNFTQPGQTIINIPAAMQSEDIKTREKFERNFNGTVSEENAWTYKWESAKNRLVCEPAAFLPIMADYPGPGDKWDEIPVGVQGDGSQAIMPLSVAPHALVCGPTGSGKSVLQRMILFHVLAHSDTWRIVAIDMKKVEMTWLRKYDSVLKVATDLEESVEVLRSLRAEMMRRYEEMEEAGVNHAKDLPNPPKAILCMIDETTVLLAAEGIKSDEGKERDELHAEAQMIIGELGRLSRASMIHVIMCFQRPDAKYLGGEIKANFDLRIAAGRMDTTPSLMVLDSEAANRLPKVKGRGMIRVGGELETFQGYFAEQSWYDKWVAQRNGGTAAGGNTDDEGPGPDGDDNGGHEPDGPPPALPPGGGAPEIEAAPSGKARKGLRGLAAKAAAKAQERAARLDAEAGLDVSAEGWVDDDVQAPAAALSPEAPAAPVPSMSPVPAAPPAPPAHLLPPGVAVAPSVEAGPVSGEPVEEFDFDALLVDVDDLDEYDEADDDYDDEEFDEEFDVEVPQVSAPPAPAPAPTAPSAPARPSLPQPVAEPVQMYRPGGAVAPQAVPPSVAPPAQAQSPASVVPPAPVGLPVRPPMLPVRPPQPPAAP